MNKLFGEIKVGDKFSLNGIEYVKTPDVRVSCCRTVNCQSVSNPDQKTFVSVDTVIVYNG